MIWGRSHADNTYVNVHYKRDPHSVYTGVRTEHPYI